MKTQHAIPILALLLLAAALAACGGSPEPASYTDPFAYCAAVGTVDKPGAEYTGPAFSEDLALAIQRAMNVPDTPLEILQNGSTWRCVDGKVYGCFVGANLPCEAKANTSEEPDEAMIEFCQANPDADVVPAAVARQEAVYEWRCGGTQPEIVRQVATVDAQGFIADIWYELSAE